MFEEDEGGGKIDMTFDLLWENEHYDSAFDEQTIDVAGIKVSINSNSTGTTDTQSCVPYRIYGIK